MSVRADWSPQQYRQFAAERAQPFHDLLGLIADGGIGRAVDLGCGPGELTALAARQLDVGEMVGVDNSPAMLASAAEQAGDRLRFEFGDIGAWTASGGFDLVLANAALHWVSDHPAVLARWTAALDPGGQLAVQVPANANMPTHRVAREVAEREPYRSAFGPGGPPPDPVEVNVLEPERYAVILHDLGFARQHVRLQVYPHVLPSSVHAVEWVRGTMLTRFQKALPGELFDRFLGDYTAALLEEIGTHEPYFFPFRRILFWGRLGG